MPIWLQHAQLVVLLVNPCRLWYLPYRWMEQPIMFLDHRTQHVRTRWGSVQAIIWTNVIYISAPGKCSFKQENNKSKLENVRGKKLTLSQQRCCAKDLHSTSMDIVNVYTKPCNIAPNKIFTALSICSWASISSQKNWKSYRVYQSINQLKLNPKLVGAMWILYIYSTLLRFKWWQWNIWRG